jgi:hypothetical protein
LSCACFRRKVALSTVTADLRSACQCAALPADQVAAAEVAITGMMRMS